MITRYGATRHTHCLLRTTLTHRTPLAFPRQTLFVIVLTLFGAMNLGAVVGALMDRRERVHVLARLCNPKSGYRMAEDRAWLWRFGLDELTDELAAPKGPAVELAAVFGMPFARLRAALPDEFFSARLSSALGRRHGFSAAGMHAATEWHRDLLSSRRRSTRLSTTMKLNEKESQASPDELLRLEEFIGTALVLAFLQITQLMPVVEIAKRRAAADAHFSDLLSPAGWSFNDTATAFLTLLSPGILNTREKWWVKARLWKLILSQSPQGFWDPTHTVAFSLEARSVKEVSTVKPTLLERIKDRLADFGDVADDLLAHGDDGLEGEATQARESVQAPLGSMAPQTEEAQEVSDDPLFCSSSAIVDAMPRRLAALGPECQPARVWATLCCIGLLQTLNCTWLWGPTSDNGDAYPPQERTIVDAGREWVEQLAAEQPALAAALADGALAKAGVQTVARWHRAWERRVDELRAGEAVTKTMLTAHAHRTTVEMMRAVCTKHETMAVFLSAPLDGMQRWQMWMILLSVIASQLLVNSARTWHNAVRNELFG